MDGAGASLRGLLLGAAGAGPIPEISAERIWTGELFTDAETFLSDHVAWRDPILKANTALDLGLGRPKVNDQVVSTDKLLAAYGFSRWGLDYLGPQAAEAAENYRALNEKITAYGGYFCYLGLPLQSSYFADHYPDYLESRLWHTTAIRESFAAAMAEEGVPFLGMYDVYAAEGLPEEYYYATDHHYTIRARCGRPRRRWSASTPTPAGPGSAERRGLRLGDSAEPLFGLLQPEALRPLGQ